MTKVAAIIAAVVTVVAVVILMGTGSGKNAPEQPITFSHKIHAGDIKIPCLYCHFNARRSPVAGVPSVQLCMGCHENIAMDKPEVQKLLGYWTRKEPIPWVKVYDQPDFVYFSHKRHIWKGIACTECHGPVETMDRIEEVGVLDMDRCVSCHMERKASIDCLTCHK